MSLTLVNNGQPASTIIVAKQPTTTAVYAATELQSDLKQITGATVPIATDDQSVTGTRILVGDSLATQALGYQASSFGPQQYTIGYQSDTLVLEGNDNADHALAGTLTGTPASVTGKFGNALEFDGSDAVAMPNSGFSDTAGTMECWVHFTAGSNAQGNILRVNGSNPWTYHILQRTSTTRCST